MSRFRDEKDTFSKTMVTPLTFLGDDHAMIRALPDGHPGAVAAFYDRYAPHVLRTLQSMMGADADVPDLLQEVFIRAIDGIRGLKESDRLRGWLTSIAIFTARSHIRRRTRRNWLGLRSPTPNLQQDPPCLDARNALREVYRLMDQIPVNDRMAFALRYIEGMTLPDAAEASGVSLATLKRRLSRAEKQFIAGAQARPALATWLKEGSRWSLLKNS